MLAAQYPLPVAAMSFSANEQSKALSRQSRSLRYPWPGEHKVIRLSLAWRASSHEALQESTAIRPRGSIEMAVTDSP